MCILSLSDFGVHFIIYIYILITIILYLCQEIVISEELQDNFTLGLAALLAGDFAFLPQETKLHKVAPAGWRGNSKKHSVRSCTFTLYLRVKFFMPSLRGVRYVLAILIFLPCIWSVQRRALFNVLQNSRVPCHMGEINLVLLVLFCGPVLLKIRRAAIL